jgi:hypothetical protein
LLLLLRVDHVRGAVVAGQRRHLRELLLLLQRREGAKLLARPRLLLRRCRFERRSIEGRTGLDCSERRFCLGPLNAEALPRWVARVGLALALTLARA